MFTYKPGVLQSRMLKRDKILAPTLCFVCCTKADRALVCEVCRMQIHYSCRVQPTTKGRSPPNAYTCQACVSTD